MNTCHLAIIAILTAVKHFIINRSSTFIPYPKYEYLQACSTTTSSKPLIISVLIQLQDPLGTHVAWGQGQKCYISAELEACNKRSPACKREPFCIKSTTHNPSPKPHHTSAQPNSTSQNKAQPTSAAGAGFSWLPTQGYQVFARSCTHLVKPFISKDKQDTVMREASAHHSCHHHGKAETNYHSIICSTHNPQTKQAAFRLQPQTLVFFTSSSTPIILFTVTCCLEALRAHLIHAASQRIKIPRTHLTSTAFRNCSPCSASQTFQHSTPWFSNKLLQSKTKPQLTFFSLT